METELIRRSLETPLEFPALDQTVFAGDRIIIVPDNELALMPDRLACVMDMFFDAGLRTGDLAILLLESEEQAVGQALRERSDGRWEILVHQPSRRDRIARLGVDLADRAIMLARELVDADMIITVGRYYKRSPKGHWGPHGSVFPRFSDHETVARFASAKANLNRQLRAEVNEVARQLGLLFTVQLLLDRDQIQRVASGLPERVIEFLQQDNQ